MKSFHLVDTTGRRVGKIDLDEDFVAYIEETIPDISISYSYITNALHTKKHLHEFTVVTPLSNLGG